MRGLFNVVVRFGLKRSFFLHVLVAMINEYIFQVLALHPPWSPPRGRLGRLDLLFPTSKLNNHYTQRSNPRINLPAILDLQLKSISKEISLNSVIMDLSCPL